MTSTSDRLRPILVPLLLLAAACGLADDPREEDDRHTYIRLPDSRLHDYCLQRFDLNADGRLSRYEARRVRFLSCPGLGIELAAGLEEFTALETLDLSDNRIAELDLRPFRRLRRADCARNALVRLDAGESHSLVALDCSANALVRLDLPLPSLCELRCGGNPLPTLDVSSCARRMEEVDAAACPLAVFYRRADQEILRLRLDDESVVETL